MAITFANPVVTADRLIIVGASVQTTFVLLFSAIPTNSIANAENTINTWLTVNVKDRALLCRVKSLSPLRLSILAYDLGNPRGIDLQGWTG